MCDKCKTNRLAVSFDDVLLGPLAPIELGIVPEYALLAKRDAARR
jgi:hypothetical protein